MLTLLWACAGGPADCGPTECEAVCAQVPKPPPSPGAPTPVPELTPFEHELLDPVLADIRAGVRPWSDQSVGICRGKKECDESVGPSPGELPPGDYIVRAELAVPAAGPKGTWKVRFETECLTEKPGGEPVKSTYDRTYEVQYVGPDRGSRLSPLRQIKSPSDGGAQKCTWKLTAPHADQVNTFEGSWSTPGR